MSKIKSIPGKLGKIGRFAEILLIAFLTILGGAAIVCAIIYFWGNAIIFDYVENERYIVRDFDPRDEGYVCKYPFFANPLMCAEPTVVANEHGLSFMILSYPEGIKDEKLKVYTAVNNPIDAWTYVVTVKYHSRVNIDYTVENDGKTLTVTFSGTVEQDGEKIPIEEKLIFDIENADVDNLPKWVNEDEVRDEVKEWYKYIDDPTEENRPSWALWVFEHT